MPLTRFRDALARRLDDTRDAAQQQIPGQNIRNQLPGTAIPPATGSGRGGVTLSDADPADVGTTSSGTAADVSRSDHVHGGGGGGGSLAITDGTTTVSGVDSLTVVGATIADDTGGAATLTVTGGGGGADAVTTPGGVSIPGLASTQDAAGVGGAGTAHEFASGDTAPTWSSAPAVSDVGVTVPSHLYVAPSNGSLYYGTYAWAPSGAFDARMKCVSGCGKNDTFYVGLHIQNSGNSQNVVILLKLASGIFNVETYIANSSYSQQNSVATTAPPSYLRITRDASNNIAWYFSYDGIGWYQISTASFTFTPTQIGFYVQNGAGSAGYCAIDWLRTSV